MSTAISRSIISTAVVQTVADKKRRNVPPSVWARFTALVGLGSGATPGDLELGPVDDGGGQSCGGVSEHRDQGDAKARHSTPSEPDLRHGGPTSTVTPARSSAGNVSTSATSANTMRRTTFTRGLDERLGVESGRRECRRAAGGSRVPAAIAAAVAAVNTTAQREDDFEAVGGQRERLRRALHRSLVECRLSAPLARPSSLRFDRHAKGSTLAVSQDLDANGRSDAAVGNQSDELRRVGDGLTVHLQDDVAGLEARAIRRRRPGHLGDDDAVGLRRAKLVGQLRRQRRHLDVADRSAAHLRRTW